MKKFFVLLTLLVAFSANARTQELAKSTTNPELWVCESTNMQEPQTLYLVYKDSYFMLFSSQGGMLHTGELETGVIKGVMFLTTIVKLKSGPRQLLLYTNSSLKNMIKMQIFAADGSNSSDDFICR